MKRFISVLSAFIMTFMLSVTSFAGAPVIFEQEGIINTGGEGLGLMIAAGAIGILALAGIVVFFFTGKKK